MTVRWRVPPDEASAIASALQALMMQTRGEPGCAECSLTTERGARVAIDYLERWDSEADMRRQIRSDRFAALAELIEHATEHPVIEFDLPGGVRGLDYAVDARLRPEAG